MKAPLKTGLDYFGLSTQVFSRVLANSQLVSYQECASNGGLLKINMHGRLAERSKSFWLNW